MIRRWAIIVLAIVVLFWIVVAKGTESRRQSIERVRSLARSCFADVPGSSVNTNLSGAVITLPRSSVDVRLPRSGWSWWWSVDVFKDGQKLSFSGEEHASLEVFLKQIAWRENGNRGLGYEEVWKQYGRGLLPATMVFHAQTGEAITPDLKLLLSWSLNGRNSNSCHIAYVDWLIDQGGGSETVR